MGLIQSISYLPGVGLPSYMRTWYIFILSVDWHYIGCSVCGRFRRDHLLWVFIVQVSQPLSAPSSIWCSRLLLFSLPNIHLPVTWTGPLVTAITICDLRRDCMTDLVSTKTEKLTNQSTLCSLASINTRLAKPVWRFTSYEMHSFPKQAKTVSSVPCLPNKRTTTGFTEIIFALQQSGWGGKTKLPISDTPEQIDSKTSHDYYI